MASVLVIGVDGLDWRSFLSQAQAGRTPHLSRLARRGQAGWLAASPFGDGPAAWASLACGRPLQDHQVFLREEAWAGGVRPIGRASWRARPVWERLEAQGISTASVGWPATRPGAAWAGLHIDDHFAEAAGQGPHAWALPRACAPEPYRAALRALRVHPADITGDMLQPFVPGLSTLNQDRDVALPHLATALARVSTVQAAATWLLREADPQVAFVALPWLESIRSAFGDPAREPFQQAVPAAWRFLDSLIGGLLGLTAPDALVMVVSPGRRGAPGAIIAAPRIEAADAFEGADLLDVAPTVLARLGLAAPELPGRVLQGLAGDRPLRPSPPTPTPAAAPADPDLLAQLEREGYTPAPAAPKGWWAYAAGRLALMLASHAPDASRSLAAQALELDAQEVNALMASALDAILNDRPAELAGIADALDKAAPEQLWGALARGAGHLLQDDVPSAAPWLVRAEQSADVNLLLRLAALWLQVSQPSNAERVFERVLTLESQSAAAQIGLALVAQHRRDYLLAESRLRQALKADPGRWAAYVQLARLYAQTARKAEAAAALATARRLGAPLEITTAALQV